MFAAVVNHLNAIETPADQLVILPSQIWREMFFIVIISEKDVGEEVIAFYRQFR